MQFEISVTSVQNWGNGGNGKIVIKNKGPAISNWKFQLTTHNFVIGEFWALTKVGTGNNINVAPPSWKSSLAAGEILASGFSYTNSVQVTSLQVSSETSGITITSNTPIKQPDTTSPRLISDKKVFGYYTEWSIYDRQFSVDMIPGNQLTHILYAFMLPNPNQEDYNILARNYPYPPKPYYPGIAEGTLVFHDEYAGKINIEKLKQLKVKYPHLKVLISIGGWSLSWTLSKITANATLRSNLVKSAAKFIVNEGFDGLDIDWEYPGKQGIGFNYVDEINDTANLIKLLTELRAEMDSLSPAKHLLLTAAVGTSPDVIKNYIGTDAYLDYVLLMTYDYAGAWGDGGHLTALYDHPGKTENSQFNAHAAVINVTKIGYSPSKIVLGSPMYGRGWAKISPYDTLEPIFGKNVSGPAISYSGSAGEPGLASWRHLINVVNRNGLIKYQDQIAKAIYLHNSSTGETWSYEDDSTVKYKAQYVVDNKLAGMMFWELSDDTRDGVQGILSSAVTILNLSKQEQLPTPAKKVTVTITNDGNEDLVLKPQEFLTETSPTYKLQITNINNGDFILKPKETVTITYS